MAALFDLVERHPANILALHALQRLDDLPGTETSLLRLAIHGLEAGRTFSEFHDRAAMMLSWEPEEQALMLAPDYPTAREAIDDGDDPESILRTQLDRLAKTLEPSSDEDRATELASLLAENLQTMYPDLLLLNVCRRF